MSKRMSSPAGSGFLGWLRHLWPQRSAEPEELRRARALIAAIDRGGVPLNPAKVNAIARDLGLEVSRHAPVDATIERIRQALLRAG
jgi:hypothetical protein